MKLHPCAILLHLTSLQSSTASSYYAYSFTLLLDSVAKQFELCFTSTKSYSGQPQLQLAVIASDSCKTSIIIVAYILPTLTITSILPVAGPFTYKTLWLPGNSSILQLQGAVNLVYTSKCDHQRLTAPEGHIPTCTMSRWKKISLQHKHEEHYTVELNSLSLAPALFFLFSQWRSWSYLWCLLNYCWGDMTQPKMRKSMVVSQHCFKEIKIYLASSGFQEGSKFFFKSCQHW